MTNKRNIRAPTLRLELIEQFGGTCWKDECGEDDPERLEFIHILDTPVMGRGRGRKERYWDIKKHPGSYALFCKYHHTEYDSYVKDIKEKRNEMINKEAS